MKEGTIYRKDTGRIEMTVVAPDEYGVYLQVRDANVQGVLLGHQVDGATKYIEGEKVKDRPEMSVSLSGEVYLSVGEMMRVEGIPTGTELVYPSAKAVIDDGYFEWSSVEPGSYLFTLEKFPYKEVRINAIVG